MKRKENRARGRESEMVGKRKLESESPSKNKGWVKWWKKRVESRY